GLRYANQAFTVTHFKVALEDFDRALGSAWDECIYHCQHSLEAVRDYFGDEKSGWESMRRELGLEESELRQVTDFSEKYIRHGSNREKLYHLTDKGKHQKARNSLKTCHKVIRLFADYLNNNGSHFSMIHNKGELIYSFTDNLI
ncbi:MAG: hypothetical protein KKF26_05555, partial [Chloroflexi bacterium]|nr:hypothetical protein [Chloroflexota bacterium]